MDWLTTRPWWLRSTTGVPRTTATGPKRPAWAAGCTTLRRNSKGEMIDVRCSVEGCDRPAKARGWCGTHWMRWRPAFAHPCSACGLPAQDWSYDHQDPQELRGVTRGREVPYSLDPERYRPLCRVCHYEADRHDTAWQLERQAASSDRSDGTSVSESVDAVLAAAIWHDPTARRVTADLPSSEGERERAQEMYDEDPLRYASEASDHGWSVIVGNCGGCGQPSCHEGVCLGDHCTRCPTRVAQGCVPAASDRESTP